jgi:hypothetical protein
MATSTPTCTAYAGSIEDIPSTSTPGLLFIKTLLPLTETPAHSFVLANLYSPSIIFKNNAAPPINLSTVKASGKPEKRNNAIEAINLNFRYAWDMDLGNGRRTVIYECEKYYVFKADPENPLYMPVVGILELEKVPEEARRGEDGDGEVGVAGYWATETRNWFDRVDMLKKREALGC